MKKPLIGVTARYSNENGLASHYAKTAYIEGVRMAGADVLLIPASEDPSACDRIMKSLDGLLLTGGADVSPQLYGEEPIRQVKFSRIADDRFESALIQAAREQGKPILGICRGLQILNVALGGTLYQDLHAQGAATLCHLQDEAIWEEGTHSVSVLEGTVLSGILQSSKVLVNSYHHQAVKDLASGLIVSARSSDGVVEAAETANGMVLGVQWHPERMTAQEPFMRLFRHFVEKCLEIKSEG